MHGKGWREVIVGEGLHEERGCRERGQMRGRWGKGWEEVVGSTG